MKVPLEHCPSYNNITVLTEVSGGPREGKVALQAIDMIDYPVVAFLWLLLALFFIQLLVLFSRHLSLGFQLLLFFLLLNFLLLLH